MKNYTNNESYNLHGFREQIKIKYEATKAIGRKSPNGTAALIELPTNAQPVLDQATCCALTADQQLVLELKADELNQTMLFLMNLKNKTTNKDLHLAYSQGNSTAYPTSIEAMTRFLSTQYPNNKPVNQRGGKEGDIKKGDESKSKEKDIITGNTAGAHVDKTTTNEESTPPNGTPSIGPQLLETNVQPSYSSRTV